MRQQKTPEELRAEMILAKVKAMDTMTPVQKLDYARKQYKDANINIGFQTATFLILTALRLYWEETPENLIDLTARLWEFLDVFRSADQEDKDAVVKWMDELEEVVGYSPMGDLESCLKKFREEHGYE